MIYLRPFWRKLLRTAGLAVWLFSPAPGVAAPPPPVQETASEGRAAQFVAEGVAALERDDPAAAQKLFRLALQTDKHNVAAHTYLGAMADRAGDLAEAERHFAAAAAAAPLLSSVRNNYGAVLMRLGRTTQAAAQFEISLKLDQNQPSALVNLAQIRFAAGTPDGVRAAFDLFERAHRLAPDSEIARALVVSALRLGDRAAAARYFNSYFESQSRPPNVAHPPGARAELGAALLEAGLAEEAARELAAAVDAAPSDAAAIVLLARAHLARKDVPAAGRALEGAVARGVEAATVYAALADVYRVSGHIENAIPAMRLAIERDPDNESYRFRYGMLLTDTRAPKAAAIRLKEAVEKFPRSSRLWFALGVAHFTDSKLDEAARAFGRAAEIEPTFAPAVAYLGMTYAEQGRFAEAIPFYEKAVAADERLAAVRYLLADALLKQPAPDAPRAEVHLARAVAIDPSFVPAQLALAKLYANDNRLAEAARHLERVVAVEPNLAEAQYHLGRVYQRLKRTAEAQVALANFKRLRDSQQEQAEAERREVVRRLADVRF